MGTRFTLALAPTLSLDGTPEDGSYDQVSAHLCNRFRFPILAKSLHTLVIVSSSPHTSSALSSHFQSGKESLADSYEYVMYGKVFKKEDENSGGIQKRWGSAAQPDCLFVVCQRTRTHSPHPPPQPHTRSLARQLNLIVCT